jgi:hypothetical protein
VQARPKSFKASTEVLRPFWPGMPGFSFVCFYFIFSPGAIWTNYALLYLIATESSRTLQSFDVGGRFRVDDFEPGPRRPSRTRLSRHFHLWALTPLYHYTLVQQTNRAKEERDRGSCFYKDGLLAPPNGAPHQPSSLVKIPPSHAQLPT